MEETTFHAPYMKFENTVPNWEDLYKCISSPFATEITQFLSYKTKQRQLELEYREGKSELGILF